MDYMDQFEETMRELLNQPMTTLTPGAVGVIAQEIMLAGANVAAGPYNWQSEIGTLKKKIKNHLSVGFDKFPDVLRLLFQKDCILSGSSITSIYHNETVKDYDFWFKPGPFSAADAIRKNIVEKYTDIILDISENYGQSGAKGAPELCVTANAITFKNKFQLITLGDYHSERKNFDFLHCTPYYDLDADKFYISERQFDAIKRKKLIRHSETREIEQYRISKFKERGFTV